MADFDEALNGILSNPAAMEQIARLAQSFNAGSPPNAGNPTAPETPGNPTAPPAPGNSMPPPAAGNPMPPPAAENPMPPPAAENPVLPGQSAEMEILQRLLPLVREWGVQRDSNARRLLYALRPYLPPARQEKIERALRLARLCQIAKRFLSQQEKQSAGQRET